MRGGRVPVGGGGGIVAGRVPPVCPHDAVPWPSAAMAAPPPPPPAVISSAYPENCTARPQASLAADPSRQRHPRQPPSRRGPRRAAADLAPGGEEEALGQMA
mmetsp:Transcript_54063/g.167818  ORF Transcript_54063/g.167818 Transcript_54063/m.167818 type:complete len:102 (+) Transcript_54063:1276-1581(+)